MRTSSGAIGQISEMASRYYDPGLSRFTSADSIIPGEGDVDAWDRYAFVNNNPLRYNDPTGHMVADDTDGGCGLTGCKKQNVTPPPPYKPTSTPRNSVPPFPLVTPIPTTSLYYYEQATRSTPDGLQNQPGIQVQIQFDITNVDWIDAAIDTVGLATNGANIGLTIAAHPEIGLPLDAIGDIFEIGGLIKTVVDTSQGDFQNLRIQLATDSAKQLALIAKVERAIPYIGFIGNAVSLWLNFKPTVSIDFGN